MGAPNSKSADRNLPDAPFEERISKTNPGAMKCQGITVDHALLL